MTCRLRFVRKKSQAPRQTQRKTHKLAAQPSSKGIGVTNNDERRGCSPMTVFPEFVTPADITLDAPVDLRQQERTIGSVGEQLAQHVGVDHSDGPAALGFLETGRRRSAPLCL